MAVKPAKTATAPMKPSTVAPSKVAPAKGAPAKGVAPTKLAPVKTPPAKTTPVKQATPIKKEVSVEQVPSSPTEALKVLQNINAPTEEPTQRSREPSIESAPEETEEDKELHEELERAAVAVTNVWKCLLIEIGCKYCSCKY